jgi:hypothetical protein
MDDVLAQAEELLRQTQALRIRADSTLTAPNVLESYQPELR